MGKGGSRENSQKITVINHSDLDQKNTVEVGRSSQIWDMFQILGGL